MGRRETLTETEIKRKKKKVAKIPKLQALNTGWKDTFSCTKINGFVQYK